MALTMAAGSATSVAARSSVPHVLHECLGRRATITGTRKDDVIRGTDRRDVIWTGKGDDEVEARDGNDLICLGGGSDRADGDDGRDVILGGPDHDELDGVRGDDTLLGAGGHDVLDDSGAHDSDTMVGGARGDRISGGRSLFGGRGNDSLSGEEDPDVIYPGAGKDVVGGGEGGGDIVSFRFSPNAIDANLSQPDLTMATGEGGAILYEIEGLTGSRHDDTFVGNAQSNWLEGLAGDDRLEGVGGDDSIDGGRGDDFLDGGSDHDQVRFASASSGVTVSLIDNAATGSGADELVGFEGIFGSAFDDHLTGDDNPNNLDGWHGNNVLDAGAGDDILYNGSGDAGPGTDYCERAYADNCESTAVVDPLGNTSITSPVIGQRSHDLSRVSGIISPGFGSAIEGDDVFVGLRRISPGGCEWWSARATRLLTGNCDRPAWNRVPIVDDRWTLRIAGDLPAGAYRACSAGAHHTTTCYDSFFGPNIVDFELES